MAITLATAARNVACDAVVDLLDAGGPGIMEIANSSGFASGTNILATITLNATAFGSASSGSASLSGTPKQDTSADNTGTAALWRMRTSGGTAIISGQCNTTNDNTDITLDVSARNAALDAIDNLINTTGGGTANLLIGTAGFVSTLVTIPLSNPAFATASSGSMAITGTPSANATVAGTAAVFRITDRAGTEVLNGTVGTSATDIVFSNNVFGVGSTITVSTFSLSLPATSAASSAVLVFAGGLAFTAGETIEVSSCSYSQPA